MKVRHISPERWRTALLAYIAGGVFLGLVPLGVLLQMGLSLQAAMVAIVVIMLPIWMVAVSVWYPRLSTILPGAIALVAGFIVGVRLYENPKVWSWKPSVLLAMAEPEFQLATVGCAAIGMFAWWVVGAVRKVELPDAMERCRHCGYLLTGISPRRCPECGQ